jgi:cellulose synthase/poly-beta-1,6-N-acetylglucosamine synthase-like glycosyltransferase
MIENLCIFVLSIYLIIQFGVLFGLLVYKKKVFVELVEYPFISLLIAARNEEDKIEDCLKSIAALNYPADKIEVIVGNDASSDNTQAIVERFISDKQNFKLINLDGTENSSTKGKARVLATLAQHAKGDYYLITDADVEVGPLWAKGLISEMVHSKLHLIGGTTHVKATSKFEQYQQVDWFYFMGIINVVDSLNYPLTMVGNNMAISAEAYRKVGGYETIPFSITEDYALFNSVRKEGFKTAQIFNQETLVRTRAINSVVGILKQRKRWLKGGWSLPFIYRMMMFVLGAWYFTLPLLFVLNWKLGLLFFLVKIVLQLLQLLKMYRLISLRPQHYFAIFTYDVYLFFIMPSISLYFILPFANTWKGRRY